ncbi:sugar kinase [Angustibacter sp. McL0619]|uniref:sugar kinase n=1 Tax=Angustibacter sp. McL0619 TaxID=3415676 RepID=UPI003CF6FB3D
MGEARVVCIGEGLVVLTGADSPSLAEAGLLRRSVGGAEGNVASGLAALGLRPSWVSRVGDDPFGEYVVRDLARRGIEVGAVQVDPTRPTGMYLKDRHGVRSRMHYYRAGSAASAMDPAFLSVPAVAAALSAADLVHVSGITLGVVADPAAFVDALLALRDRVGMLLSVDLNWRPVLWQGRDGAELARLLAAADIALLGSDEAQLALGADDVTGLRELLGPRPTLVLKSDDHQAVSAPAHGAPTAVPALAVDVRDPIGAGDAFAAGYLAGHLASRPPRESLRLGHLTAATVLVVEGDHAEAIDPAVREALLRCADEQWAATVVRPTGIDSPALADLPDEEMTR